jgi:hypothetical protein
MEIHTMDTWPVCWPSQDMSQSLFPAAIPLPFPSPKLPEAFLSSARWSRFQKSVLARIYGQNGEVQVCKY